MQIEPENIQQAIEELDTLFKQAERVQQEIAISVIIEALKLECLVDNENYQRICRALSQLDQDLKLH